MKAQTILERIERIGRGTIGLFCCAGFGALIGLRTGALTGCAVGTIVPIIGNVCGLIVGGFVGALAGVPAGILCGALQGRNGCRAGGALPAALVPVAYGVCNGATAVPTYDMGVVTVILTAFAAVGTVAGDWVWRRLEVATPGMFADWKRQNERWGLYDLSLPDRLLSVLMVVLPALTYLLTGR